MLAGECASFVMRDASTVPLTPGPAMTKPARGEESNTQYALRVTYDV